MQNHSKSLHQHHYTSLYKIIFSVTLRKISQLWLHSLQKQLNFIGFWNFRNSPNIDFRSSRTQLQFHWFLNTLETISILTFSNCGGNSNSLVFKTLKKIPTLALLIVKAIQIHWFSRPRKQSQHWLLLIAKAIQINWFPTLRKQSQQ